MTQSNAETKSLLKLHAVDYPHPNFFFTSLKPVSNQSNPHEATKLLLIALERYKVQALPIETKLFRDDTSSKLTSTYQTNESSVNWVEILKELCKHSIDPASQFHFRDYSTKKKGKSKIPI
jgi:aminoglycoside/choline kinase family phosphotransferase